MSHKIVLAKVLIASTFWMTLIEAEDFIDWSLSTKLICNHLTRSRRHCFTVGRILKLAVPFVARTLPRVLTAIKAVAETSSSCFLQVLSYVVIDDNVRLDVLRIEIFLENSHKTIKKTEFHLHTKFDPWNHFGKDLQYRHHFANRDSWL